MLAMPWSTNSLDDLVTKCQSLPPVLQQQVIDFVDFLADKYVPSQPPLDNGNLELQTEQKRILGLHRGKVWISDDFDASLPDDFWLGKVE
jgi:hypothetical protein